MKGDPIFGVHVVFLPFNKTEFLEHNVVRVMAFLTFVCLKCYCCCAGNVEKLKGVGEKSTLAQKNR